jgi:ubiquinone/menaquinone biosynthesis C-methylase UbiE
MGDRPVRWDHSIEYHDELVSSLGTGLRRALDVGCGDGFLARRLREVADEVVGLDPHLASLGRARDRHPTPGVRLVCGGVLDAPFRPGSFDAVTCVMVLHHMDEEAGLRRMADLLAPGGRLVVLGCGRRTRRDALWDVAGFATHRVRSLRRGGFWVQDSPMVWPPPHTWPEIRALAERVLPGCRWERKVLFRYVLTWTKPS